MTEAARDAFGLSGEDDPDRSQGQRWRSERRYRDVVRLLVRTAGSSFFEGWGGVPESLAPLIADDAELAGHLLEDPDLDVRRLTVMALAGVCRPWALDMLTAAMADPVPEIRALAAESADRWHACHQPNARPPSLLVERVLSLVDDPCEEVRLSVVGPVVRLGGESGVRSLLDVYETSDELMRGEILGALASAGYHAVVARLASFTQAAEQATPYLRRILLRLACLGPEPSSCAGDRPATNGQWGEAWAEGGEHLPGSAGP